MAGFLILLTIFAAAFGSVLADCLTRRDEPRPSWWSNRPVTPPPISDEEFLRRCGSEIPPEIALGVRKTLSDALGIDEATIYPEHRLIEDLGAE